MGSVGRDHGTNVEFISQKLIRRLRTVRFAQYRSDVGTVSPGSPDGSTVGVCDRERDRIVTGLGSNESSRIADAGFSLDGDLDGSIRAIHLLEKNACRRVKLASLHRADEMFRSEVFGANHDPGTTGKDAAAEWVMAGGSRMMTREPRSRSGPRCHEVCVTWLSARR